MRKKDLEKYIHRHENGRKKEKESERFVELNSGSTIVP